MADLKKFFVSLRKLIREIRRGFNDPLDARIRRAHERRKRDQRIMAKHNT